MSGQRGGAGRAAWVRAAVGRTVLLTLVWVAVIEVETSVAVYGLGVVPLAVATSLLLTPPAPARGSWPRRAVAAVGLLGWFLWQSVRGGADVARRAVAGPVRLDPVERRYRWRCGSSRVRVAVAGLNGLMPGTLTVAQDEEALTLHVLHHELDTDPQLAQLERRVAAVLGEPVPAA
jgi:multicomponent Na+:H+ antiporter subunit E